VVIIIKFLEIAYRSLFLSGPAHSWQREGSKKRLPGTKPDKKKKTDARPKERQTKQGKVDETRREGTEIYKKTYK
jgi:hypothetical protein